MRRSQRIMALASTYLVLQLGIVSFTRPIYAQPIRSASPSGRPSFHPVGWAGDVANAVVGYGLAAGAALYGLATGAGNYLSGLIGHHEHRVQPALPTALD